MNREQLEEIRARAEKATKGPWRVVVDDSEKATTVCRECESDAHPLDEDPGRDYLYDDCLDGELHSEPFFREADAEFIAHARTDVPALLDEIGRQAPVIAAALAWFVELGPTHGATVEHQLADAIEALAEGSAEGGTSKDSSTTDGRCPTCDSPEPRLHPAIQADGEVTAICRDAYHDVPTEGGAHP